MVNIYKTTDYDQFKLFSGRNRQVITNKVYESVKRKNKLEQNPIVVTSDMHVLDGQHRLDAARRLQVPIYYQIDPDATVEDIALYQVQTSWCMRNHLDFYEKEKKEYNFVKMICETYGLFHHLTFVIKMCSCSDVPTLDFKNGTYRLKANPLLIERNFSNLHDITNKIKAIEPNSYVCQNALAALMSIISNEGYDHKVFMRKLDLYPDKVLQVLKFREYKSLKEKFQKDVYNYYARGEEKKLRIG